MSCKFTLALHHWTECCSRIIRNVRHSTFPVDATGPASLLNARSDDRRACSYLYHGRETLTHSLVLSVNPLTSSVVINASNNMRIPESWKVSEFTHESDENEQLALAKDGSSKTNKWPDRGCDTMNTI